MWTNQTSPREGRPESYVQRRRLSGHQLPVAGAQIRQAPINTQNVITYDVVVAWTTAL